MKTKTEEKYQVLNVRFEHPYHKILRKMAFDKGVSMAELVRQAVMEKYFEKEEK